MSKFKGVKTDNAKITTKEKLRKKALSLIDSPKVLDVFCGDGEMYRAVYKDSCKDYLGLDKRCFSDERKTITCDSIEFIKSMQAVDYNIIDIDAYGSPYSALYEITKKPISHNRIAFILTDGVEMDLRMGNICHGIRMLSDLKLSRVANAHFMHRSLIKRIINKTATLLNKRVSHFSYAKGKTGAAVYYIIFVVD